MANNIFVLDDGTKEITFNNQFGEEICKIHIRSGDISIIDRYQALMHDFDGIVAPLSGVKLRNDGTSSFEDEWKVIKEVEQKIIERINAVFDTRDAGNLFAQRNAFSTINGEFYVEKVLTALGNVVSEEIKHESELAQARIGKYLTDIKDEEKADEAKPESD